MYKLREFTIVFNDEFFIHHKIPDKILFTYPIRDTEYGH